MRRGLEGVREPRSLEMSESSENTVLSLEIACALESAARARFGGACALESAARARFGGACALESAARALLGAAWALESAAGLLRGRLRTRKCRSSPLRSPLGARKCRSRSLWSCLSARNLLLEPASELQSARGSCTSLMCRSRYSKSLFEVACLCNT